MSGPGPAALPVAGPPSRGGDPAAAGSFLELAGIGKTYPGVTALAGVSLAVAPGEVVGLIGENGAGKSTLMKVLGGVVAPSAGTIRIDGVEHGALSVVASLRAGIAFVHQELNLFDNLDVAANIFIGREPLTGGPLRLVDRARLEALVRPLLARLSVDFGPRTAVAELSLAQRQMVEIAKALSLDARLIIMDEPTSSLTLSETERLLKVVAELKAQGVAVIYITHRLGEVQAIADRVVCLRDGKLVGELAKGQIEHAAMIRLMIGRDLKALYTPPGGEDQPGGCRVEAVRTAAFPDREVNLEVRRGEILGLAGLIGAGRTSLARALFGIEPPLAGTVTLDGEPLRVRSPRDAIRRGIYLVPEDRKRSGLVLGMPIRENTTLADLPAYASLGLVRPAAEAETATRQQAQLNIRAPSIETAAVALSGGNQQKVVLAKWLAMRPSLIVFDEPTRGIDVGAKSEIYRLMRELADRGVAILMISSDMEEVIGVSDRIAVMHEGEVSGLLERREEFSEGAVLRLAVGQKVTAAGESGGGAGADGRRPDDRRELLERVYAAFNARDIDAVLAAMHADVDWPNAWEGGRCHGRAAVRDYWTRQWAAVDPKVAPTGFRTEADGRTAVRVHAVVRDRSGALISDGLVEHVYSFEGGLIRAMEVRPVG